MIYRIKNNVDISFESSISEIKHFSHACSMWMHHSLPFLKRSPTETFLRLDGFQEFMVHIQWWIDFHIFLRRLSICVIYSNWILNVFICMGKSQTTIQISITRKPNQIQIFANQLKLTIFIPPPLFLTISQFGTHFRMVIYHFWIRNAVKKYGFVRRYYVWAELGI